MITSRRRVISRVSSPYISRTTKFLKEDRVSLSQGSSMESTRPSISFISVYTDASIFKNFLMKSLYKQNYKKKIELISVNNTGNREFKSPGEAFNTLGRRARGDFLVFIHPDVYLISSNFVEGLIQILPELPRLGAAGFAGVRGNGAFHGFLVHGIPPEMEVLGYPNPFPVQAFSIDELALIVPREVFLKIPFDEDILYWHGWGLDYSMQVRRNSLRTYIIPGFVYHRSKGRYGKDFYEVKKYLVSKWGYPLFHTSFSAIPCKSSIFLRLGASVRDKVIKGMRGVSRLKSRERGVKSILAYFYPYISDEIEEYVEKLIPRVIHMQAIMSEIYDLEISFNKTQTYRYITWGKADELVNQLLDIIASDKSIKKVVIKSPPLGSLTHFIYSFSKIKKNLDSALGNGHLKVDYEIADLLAKFVSKHIICFL